MKGIEAIWKASVVGLAVAGLVTAGCQREERVETQRGEETWEAEEGRFGDLEPAIEDATITARVLSRLAADRDVSVFDIDVSTDLGVVTLEGTVENEGQRAHAEALVLETSGVTRVENRLQVELAEGEPAAREPGATAEDPPY